MAFEHITLMRISHIFELSAQIYTTFLYLFLVGAALFFSLSPGSKQDSVRAVQVAQITFMTLGNICERKRKKEWNWSESKQNYFITTSRIYAQPTECMHVHLLIFSCYLRALLDSFRFLLLVGRVSLALAIHHPHETLKKCHKYVIFYQCALRSRRAAVCECVYLMLSQRNIFFDVEKRKWNERKRNGHGNEVNWNLLCMSWTQFCLGKINCIIILQRRKAIFNCRLEVSPWKMAKFTASIQINQKRIREWKREEKETERQKARTRERERAGERMSKKATSHHQFEKLRRLPSIFSVLAQMLTKKCCCHSIDGVSICSTAAKCFDKQFTKNSFTSWMLFFHRRIVSLSLFDSSFALSSEFNNTLDFTFQFVPNEWDKMRFIL